MGEGDGDPEMINMGSGLWGGGVPANTGVVRHGLTRDGCKAGSDGDGMRTCLWNY